MQSAVFEPPDGHAVLVIGQDLGAIGGFDAPNNQGYIDYGLPVPAGVTTYTSIGNLSGLEEAANWGAGDVWAQAIVDNSIYNESVLVIGLYLVDLLPGVINGNWDDHIDVLGEWIAAAGRPVFLRIGYEFNGSHNHYNTTQYAEAWQIIVDRLRENGVNNAAFVWQSTENGSRSQLLQWYPGDDYVDWMGVTYFGGINGAMLELAEEKGKPLLICESTPRGRRLDEADGEAVWNSWYQPLFDTIHQHEQTIKGLAYINTDWDAQPMWQDGTWGDSRIQVNETVRALWETEIASPFWLHASDTLFSLLEVTTAVGRQPVHPDAMALLSHYPNPFNSQTVIRLILDTASYVTLAIYNARGQQVDLLLDQRMSSGFHSVIWNGSGFNTGVYFLQLKAGNQTETRKLLFVK